MNIEIGYDFIKNQYIQKENHKIVNEEERILSNIIKHFSDKFDISKFKIEKKSADYTSLSFWEIDIINLKYTERAKWIKLVVVKDMVKKYYNDVLFESETNKKRIMWKSQLKNDDLSCYYEIIEYYLNTILRNK